MIPFTYLQTIDHSSPSYVTCQLFISSQIALMLSHNPSANDDRLRFISLPIYLYLCACHTNNTSNAIWHLSLNKCLMNMIYQYKLQGGRNGQKPCKTTQQQWLSSFSTHLTGQLGLHYNSGGLWPKLAISDDHYLLLFFRCFPCFCRLGNCASPGPLLFIINRSNDVTFLSHHQLHHHRSRLNHTKPCHGII